MENCKKELETLFTREKAFKRLNDSKIEKIRKNLEVIARLENVKDCDLIVETVYEDMKLKKEIFTKLDKICKPRCIFGTNTSSLDLNEVHLPKTKISRKVLVSDVLSTPESRKSRRNSLFQSGESDKNGRGYLWVGDIEGSSSDCF